MFRPEPPVRRLSAAPLALLLLGACGSGGSSSTPIGGAAVPPVLVACRARVDSPFSFAEIALRSRQNLGGTRIADKAGPERHVRVHPDGNTVVFARERENGDPDSRELFTATADGARAELRLTQNADFDDEPCWSPTGASILFASERSGVRSLWLCDADGGNERILRTPPAGNSESEPDWCRATDRIVFSSRDGTGHHSLWLVQGDGSGLVPLTDGGAATGLDSGDHHPTFAPDGSRVAFARRSAAGVSTLCLVEVALGTVTVRYQPAGEVDLPRWTPTGDQLLFGLAEPTAGRATLRLASLPVAAGDPVLLWPDERWRLEGIDVLPTFAAVPSAQAPVRLDVTKAQVQLAAGQVQSVSRAQLASADGDEYEVFTETSDGHEVAGISCRFDLPVAAPEDVLELRVRAIARTDRIGGDTQLRMSIYNPVDERFDTAVERAPTSTAAQTMQFSTTSLRHVTREKQLRVTVVGEVATGARTTLHIDLVEVFLVQRVTPP